MKHKGDGFSLSKTAFPRLINSPSFELIHLDQLVVIAIDYTIAKEQLRKVQDHGPICPVIVHVSPTGIAGRHGVQVKVHPVYTVPEATVCLTVG